MSTPPHDWVEQARRFAAGLAAEHGPGLTDALGGLLRGRAPQSGSAADHAPEGHARDDHARGDHARDDHAPGDHAAECRWCPLCAGLGALRGRRPDLLEAVADVLAAAATTLRTAAHSTPAGSPDGSNAGPVPDAPEPTGRPEKTGLRPAPAPTVQRIDVA